MSEDTSRTGLYLLVFIILITTCSNETKLERLEKQLEDCHGNVPDQQQENQPIGEVDNDRS